MPKIEALVQRPGGTVTDVGGVTYQFLPDKTGAHVAEIDDLDHVDVFLAIPDYRLAREQATRKVREAKAGNIAISTAELNTMIEGAATDPKIAIGTEPIPGLGLTEIGNAMIESAGE